MRLSCILDYSMVNDRIITFLYVFITDLGISPDVAGATFMATATCAPELFVSVIGTFLTESDLGVGTVVGSAIYNTLGVSACAGLAARKAINLEKWPLLRDSGVYLVSIIALAIIVVDDVVMWYEALFLLFMYFGYFLLMFTQGKLRTAAKKLKNKNSFRSCKYFPFFCNSHTFHNNNIIIINTVYTGQFADIAYSHFIL
jgi:Ca2+/Na+ antiporter